jgi:tRNA A37 threonylcarbamoyladenosine dehydratase
MAITTQRPYPNMLEKSLVDLEDQSYPLIYQLNCKENIDEIEQLKQNPNIKFIDKLDSQIFELLKTRHAGNSLSEKEIWDLVPGFFKENNRSSYGNWIYYPWKNKVIRLLPENDFISVRTQRNNYKITPSEQNELGRKKIGIIGLSVGQSIALAIALERSCGELRLADFDRLELSNLNRIKAGVLDLGIEKVVIAAREISEIDPYLKITLYREGISENNIDDFLQKDGALDLLIDECDSLDIKILARERARFFKIPVIMETSDRGMLDVERFDLEPDRELLHGAMGGIRHDDLKDLTQNQKVSIGLKITGATTISTRMKASLLEINQTISSWPQLASAVYLGGATVAHVGRKLLLNEHVASGRYYVDLDEIIRTKDIGPQEKQAPEKFSKSYFIEQLPTSGLESKLRLNHQEIKDLITQANLAPSGGNCQPWIWIYDMSGVLHLFHDKKRSVSLLDYKGTGSLIAFGAALENLRLAAAAFGFVIHIIPQIKSFEQELIASVVFESKSNQPIDVPFKELVEGIQLRNTNRKNEDRVIIPTEKLEAYETMAKESGSIAETISSIEDLQTLSEVIGGMDRMRLFHEQGYRDFVSEIRWSEQEAIDTGDGIDIATLELTKTDQLVMGLIRDPGTMEFFRKFDLGHGLAKISDKTLLSASAVMLVLEDEFSPMAYLNSGATLQRIWIKANQDGYSFQPISASLFVFHRVNREIENGYSESEVEVIKTLKQKLNTLFNKDLKNQEIFMFRFNVASDASIRAFRRDISESIFFL